MLVTSSKKARAPALDADTVGYSKCSLPTSISCFARPDAQEQKVAALEFLPSGTKHEQFEVSSDEASAPVLKLFMSYWSTRQVLQ